MSSRRSSQGPSQASQDRGSGSFATGDSNSTLQPLSGSQPASQASSQRLSQSQDSKLLQSQNTKLSQSQDNKLSQSQDNSQQMSQPSSMDVLASQAVSSQLLALAAANSQANLDASQDVVLSGAEGGLGSLEPTGASCEVTKVAATSSAADVISQDIFSPEDSVSATPETSQEEERLPSQEENPVSPSFDMFAPSLEAEADIKNRVNIATSSPHHVSVNASSGLMDKRDANVDSGEKSKEMRKDTAMETGSGGGPTAKAANGKCARADESK